MRTRISGWSLVLVGGTLLGGCFPPDAGSERDSQEDLVTTNGLSMINGLSMTNGLSMLNGLAGNGLSGSNLQMYPLSSKGLPATSSFMNSTAGRSTVTYLVRCALPSGHTITAKDTKGTSYSFPGQIGVAPEWESGNCNATCQERVSACMLAHVNTSGQHISIWLDSEGAIGWGSNSNYPYQEGSFFGNIFLNPPVADFCNGKDFDLGTVPGRLGVGQNNAPYKNAFWSGALCQSNCSNADSPNSNDGFKQCLSYKHVVTVWRNFDPNTQYKICNKTTSRCLEVAGSSTSDGAAIQQRTFSGGSNQKWTITQVSPLKYKVVNVNSGKSLDSKSGSTSSGTAVIQDGYKGSSTQLWAFTSLGDQPGFYEITPTANSWASITPWGSLYSDGTPIQEWTYLTADFQKWTITPAN